MLDEAIKTLDEGKREALLKEIGVQYMRDVAIIPLYWQVNVWATRKGLPEDLELGGAGMMLSLGPEEDADSGAGEKTLRDVPRRRRRMQARWGLRRLFPARRWRLRRFPNRTSSLP